MGPGSLPAQLSCSLLHLQAPQKGSEKHSVALVWLHPTWAVSFPSLGTSFPSGTKWGGTILSSFSPKGLLRALGLPQGQDRTLLQAGSEQGD